MGWGGGVEGNGIFFQFYSSAGLVRALPYTSRHETTDWHLSPVKYVHELKQTELHRRIKRTTWANGFGQNCFHSVGNKHILRGKFVFIRLVMYESCRNVLYTKINCLVYLCRLAVAAFPK